ncbi:MATE family efflux transporter [Rhodobacteraceae bacterium NNCM2]|nr:MATE family efflux transporter [Coraliihabitans acroporae]
MSAAGKAPGGAEAEPITYARVAAIALPVVLSNAMVPVQGAIDTAIIGNLGSEVFLAAVALGAALFMLAVGIVNFLQIGTSGLTAQALGAGNFRRVINTLIRGMILASICATILFLATGPVISHGMGFFEGSEAAETLAARYFTIRSYGFPAELTNYVLLGWFAGQEQTRRMFEMQIVVSIVNITLNLLFVIGFGWGVEGVAFGTVIATYTGLVYGLWRAWHRGWGIVPEGWKLDWPRILDRGELTQLMALNRDIFIRSALLVFSIFWITRLGSMQGDTVLAANGILLQFFEVSAFALDGFAIAAETLVGQAIGAASRARLRRAVVVSTVGAVLMAGLFSLVATFFAADIIWMFTNVEAVRETAMEVILWATFMPLFGVLAFQFDGIFFGAADGPSIRNAMILASGIFLPGSWWMTAEFGNQGLWASVATFMLLRALLLIIRYPMLEARTASGIPSASATV